MEAPAKSIPRVIMLKRSSLSIEKLKTQCKPPRFRCCAKAMFGAELGRRALIIDLPPAQVKLQIRLGMQKAALLYNPESGGSKQRQQDLEAALSIFKRGGVDAELFPTRSVQHAGEQTRQAIKNGCDTVFACGGDGTVHNTVQILAGTSVALGVLPMGTANALAHDLRIPLRIPAAAEAALHGKTRRVALGQVTCPDVNGQANTRYFVIAAGMGVDAHLFYKLHSGMKQRLGMRAYYAKAWHLWFTYPMTRFRVNYAESGSEAEQNVNVTELLAVRIRHFGGVLRELAPGASLDRNDMRLIFCHTGSRLAYLAYITRSLLGAAWSIRGIELASCTSAQCDYIESTDGTPQARVYVEADGELIGRLPAQLSVVPDALTILAPSAS
jgi:diacylglycerol kinase (ATP)